MATDATIGCTVEGDWMWGVGGLSTTRRIVTLTPYKLSYYYYYYYYYYCYYSQG